MKLYSKNSARYSANKKRQHPRVGVIVLISVNVLLFLALAILIISAILRSNKNTQEQDALTSEDYGVGMLSPSPDNTPELPLKEETPAIPAITDTEQSDDTAQLQESPTSPFKETGDSNTDIKQESDSEDPTDDTQESINETVEASPEVSPEVSPGTSPEGSHVTSLENSGGQFFLDDSGLFASAGNVYYHIYCFDTGDYAASGSSAKTLSASVIKVFIMEYAFVKSAQGALDLREIINGSTILSLITTMIRQSDNNATNALIGRFGMDILNSFFVEQGYSDTVLERNMLDYDRRRAGFDNYTSLSDCAAFLEKLYLKREEEPYRQMLEIMKGQQIRTKIPLRLPSGVVVANKTGELEDVENDIGIVFAENAPFAIIVLSSEVYNTANMRNAIADFTFSAYAWVTR